MVCGHLPRVRTPLAVLIGETEGLLEGIREITPEAVRSLHGEALRLNHLVDDLYQLALLDLGKLTYHKETFDLTGLIDSVIETFAPQSAAKGIALSRDLPQAPWKTVHADRQRLRQMLVNLFDNSLKYTDPGGAIMVRLLYTDGRAVIECWRIRPPVSPAGSWKGCSTGSIVSRAHGVGHRVGLAWALQYARAS